MTVPENSALIVKRFRDLACCSSDEGDGDASDVGNDDDEDDGEDSDQEEEKKAKVDLFKEPRFWSEEALVRILQEGTLVVSGADDHPQAGTIAKAKSLAKAGAADPYQRALAMGEIWRLRGGASCCRFERQGANPRT